MNCIKRKNITVLGVAGDVGGARTLLPVLKHLSLKNVSIAVIAYGVIEQESEEKWEKISLMDDSLVGIKKGLKDYNVRIVLIGTSVNDKVPLRVAQYLQKTGSFVVVLLDGWMNYKQRLQLNENEYFMPDIFSVMDEYSMNEAIVDGIPKSIIRITGHQEFSSLDTEYYDWKKNININKMSTTSKKVIVFISEPVSKDQGSDKKSSYFRGYTEKIILKQFFQTMQSKKKEYKIIIVPHPREDVKSLRHFWENYRGDLDGEIKMYSKGRYAVFEADGVVGMASTLLYEAWLINKPVISLQLDCCLPHLYWMKNLSDFYSVFRYQEWDKTINIWLYSFRCLAKKGLRQEFEGHKNAVINICKLLPNESYV